MKRLCTAIAGTSAPFFRYFGFAAILNLLFLGLAIPAAGQSIDSETNRLTAKVSVIDGATLRSEDYLIKIWGIEPFVSSDSEVVIRSRDALEKLIASQPVNCRVLARSRSAVVGRCGVTSGQDVGLYMIQNGYALVDRAAVFGTPYAENYEKAEFLARRNRQGIWAHFREDAVSQNLPPWLTEYLPTLVPVGLLVIPFLGLLLVAVSMKRGLRRIEQRYEQAFAEARAKQDSLEERERAVLASALEGELIDNTNKIDAFLTIYREMLKDLNDTTKIPSYQEKEELVHQRPALGRTVFDANVDRLSVFEMKLGSEIAKLYVSISSEPEYQILNQKTPISTAKGIIKDIISEAESLKAHIEDMATRLHSISSKYAATQKLDLEDQFDFEDEGSAAEEPSEENAVDTDEADGLVARGPGHMV